MKTRRQRVGAYGERLAREYLQKKGYSLLGENVRTEHGEIDLVMRLAERIVFVEVKTRSSDVFGAPETSITQKKQSTLAACSQAYLDLHLPHAADWQIDVVAIRLFPDQPPQIIHLENAVTG